jgi:hypothetical protein
MAEQIISHFCFAKAHFEYIQGINADFHPKVHECVLPTTRLELYECMWAILALSAALLTHLNSILYKLILKDNVSLIVSGPSASGHCLVSLPSSLHLSSFVPIKADARRTLNNGNCKYCC